MIKYLLFLLLFFISCEKKIDKNLNTSKGDKLYKEGENLLLKDNVESYLKFQQAIIFYSKNKDSSNISKSLICQAIAQKFSGDVLGAEATLVEALKLMKDNDESLYSVYGTLGDLKSEEKQYLQAITWYNKSLSEKIKSLEVKANILNNKSVAAFKSGKYSEALDILQKINIKQIERTELKNRIKDNIEYVKWLQNKNYPAEQKIEEIAQNKIQNSDFWGLNSSYAHLSDINKNSNIKKSLFYAKKRFDIAENIKSPEDRLEAIERLIFLDTPVNSKKYFAQYKNLSDSIQNTRNDYRTRFSYIKYDSEKKNAENQRLKLQDSENEIKILQRNVGIGALSILIIAGVFYYKKRKKRLQQEKELEVKNTQLKMSKKVHDVVANGIYQVMTKIENQEYFDRDKALDELEFVYEKSRDISYEKIDGKQEEKDFDEKISELIGSFKNETVNTYIAGNDKDLWENVSQTIQDEVYQIIRELLVNMKKHSEAERVAFRFERDNNLINILYTDNGIGILGDIIYKNGLSSTVSRIENIKGEIIFDTKTEKGLKINISFPASLKS